MNLCFLVKLNMQYINKFCSFLSTLAQGGSRSEWGREDGSRNRGVQCHGQGQGYRSLTFRV